MNLTSKLLSFLFVCATMTPIYAASFDKIHMLKEAGIVLGSALTGAVALQLLHGDSLTDKEEMVFYTTTGLIGIGLYEAIASVQKKLEKYISSDKHSILWLQTPAQVALLAGIGNTRYSYLAAALIPYLLCKLCRKKQDANSSEEENEAVL